MKYIDVEKLKELIDKKWKELADKNVKVGGGKWDAEISTYLSVLRLIDSLQQKQSEVELEERKQFAISILCSLCQGVSSARVIFKVDMHCTTIAIDTNRLVEDAVKMTDELIKQLGL